MVSSPAALPRADHPGPRRCSSWSGRAAPRVWGGPLVEAGTAARAKLQPRGAAREQPQFRGGGGGPPTRCTRRAPATLPSGGSPQPASADAHAAAAPNSDRRPAVGPRWDRRTVGTPGDTPKPTSKTAQNRVKGRFESKGFYSAKTGRRSDELSVTYSPKIKFFFFTYFQ